MTDQATNVELLLRPTSVAVVGISSAGGSMAERTLMNLIRFGFPGTLYGVSKSRTDVAGVPCVPTISDLPLGIETAVLSVPREGVEAAIAACVDRGIKAAVIYSAGFAEEGDEGKADQERIAEFARRNDITLAGPNCLGLINYVDNVPLSFGPLKPEPLEGRPAVAIISQSGAMMANAMISLHARGVAVSYAVSTGNEGSVSIVDYMDALARDPHTKVFCICAELIRQSQQFIAAIRAISDAGKTIVLLHPGRGVAAREAAMSHTGALAGDYDVMSAILAHEPLHHVETMEEFIDVAELLVRNEPLSTGGLAILTDSGAAKALMLDYCEKLGLPLTKCTSETDARLHKLLPPFASISNPLDVTAIILRDDALLGEIASVMIADPGVAASLISVMPDPVGYPLFKTEGAAAAATKEGKTLAYAVVGGEAALSDGFEEAVRSAKGSFNRSPERALRALSILFQRRDQAQQAGARGVPVGGVLTADDLAYEASLKAALSRLGIVVPEGSFVRTVEEARQTAERIGYPVVLKVQSSAIQHKTEVGGVKVGIADSDALAVAWTTMGESLAARAAGLPIDGYLVEKMGRSGIELVVGAKRDPDWGVTMMVGLGGVWLEVMRDRRLFPSDLGRASIRAELEKLKAAPMLHGTRGQPGCDIDSLIDVVMALAGLMEANTQIREFEINPLVLYPEGLGHAALDALAIVEADEG
ncbi:acyl-CoA synthetase (NDP forming) [Sphingobium sp. JAI105]|nr:acyl-CoA synthetase (NDP forming) [Sphingobium sp. JAI105]